MITRNKRMAEIHELKKMLEDVKQELINNNNNKIDILVAKIEERKKKINELEDEVNHLEDKVCFQVNHCQLLERKLDDTEQYTRRLSLRINGIDDGRESDDDCLSKVKDEISKLGVTVADCEFDRAHRVGRKTDTQGTRVQSRQMIVRFTSWRARTLVYRHRSKEGNVRFYIDQTKRRFQLRKTAVDMDKDKPDVDFVYKYDIN